MPNINFHRKHVGSSASRPISETRRHLAVAPGFKIIRFGRRPSWRRRSRQTPVCAFMIEPIQGEAASLSTVCDLFQEGAELALRTTDADYRQSQTGLGRTRQAARRTARRQSRRKWTMSARHCRAGFHISLSAGCFQQRRACTEPGKHGSDFRGNRSPAGGERCVTPCSRRRDDETRPSRVPASTKACEASAPTPSTTKFADAGLMLAVALARKQEAATPATRSDERAKRASCKDNHGQTDPYSPAMGIRAEPVDGAVDGTDRGARNKENRISVTGNAAAVGCRFKPPEHAVDASSQDQTHRLAPTSH